MKEKKGLTILSVKLKMSGEDNVVEIAHRVHLDTVYFLRSQGEERGEES